MPRLQFSLRTLLLTTLVLPLAVSFWLHSGPVEKTIQLHAGPLHCINDRTTLDLEFAAEDRIIATWPSMFAMWTPDGTRQLESALYPGKVGIT